MPAPIASYQKECLSLSMCSSALAPFRTIDDMLSEELTSARVSTCRDRRLRLVHPLASHIGLQEVSDEFPGPRQCRQATA